MVGKERGDHLVDFEAVEAVMREDAAQIGQESRDGYLHIGVGKDEKEDGEGVWIVRMKMWRLKGCKLGRAVWIRGRKVYEFGGGV